MKTHLKILFLSFMITGFAFALVAQAVPTKIVFKTAERTSNVGVSSDVITVQLQDGSNNPDVSSGTTTINLSTDSSGVFSDIANSTNLTSVSIPNGNSERSFRYTGNAIGTHVLTATDAAASLTAGNQNFNVVNFPDVVQKFFIPIPEDQLLEGLDSIGTAANTPVVNRISLAILSDNTVIYFDQFEDGYEADISSPNDLYSGSNLDGTQVWGDGDTSNGTAPGYPSDVLSSGDVIVLSASVAVPIPANNIAFGGRDKIGSSKPIAVARAGWATGSNTLLAGANEIFDTSNWGTEYRSPIGEDMNGGQVGNSFEYTSLLIMAGEGGANLQIDADANGTFELTPTLAEGASYHVDGGVDFGAKVLSDNPVQVDMITGDIGSTYQGRFIKLLPFDLWSNEYVTPVSTRSADPTTVVLYNPGSSSISVDYTRYDSGSLTTVSLSVPGGTYGNYLEQQMVNGDGASFSSSTNNPFTAVSITDRNDTSHDWGFSLIPTTSLSSQFLVGLGIGRDPTSGTNPNENGNPIWVCPVGGATDVLVDFDADPTTGSLTDANGNKYDVIYSLDELEPVRIFDPDGDQTGTLVYSTNSNVKLATAWGQDPSVASGGAPGLDMGTGIPPLPLFTATKVSVINSDNDADGFLSPGDELLYSINIANASRVPVTDMTLFDGLPTGTVYVAGSTFFTDDQSVMTNLTDDVGPASAFPLDESGILLPDSTLPVGGTWLVEFKVIIQNFTNLPTGLDTIYNAGYAQTDDQIVEFETKDPIYGRIGDFVWNDANGDGIQGGLELGFSGVTVSLYDGGGTLLSTVNTESDGSYLFGGLLADDYRVVFTTPSGFEFTPQNSDALGLSGTVNSDANTNTGSTITFPLAAGEPIPYVDAGMQCGNFDLICPSDLTQSCGAVDLSTNTTGTATVNTLCGCNITIEYSDSTNTTGCVGNYSVVRTWTAYDDCGSFAQCTQTITVEDNTPPTIDTCPTNVSVQCIGDVPSVDTNLVTGTDDCGTVTVSWIGDLSDSNACPETITRTYELVDECGNATNCVQTIVVNDTISPALVGVPTNVTVECDSVPAQAVVTAIDNCSTNLTVLPSTNTIPGACADTYTLEYIWLVTDDCNNSTAATQTVSVVDTTPPVIDTCASNVTIECSTDIPPVDSNLVTGTDNCGSVTVSWLGDSFGSNTCPQIVTRTYELKDDCGNATNCYQIITINDTIPPVLVGVPTNITVECDSVPAQAVVTATDNCATGLTVIPTNNVILGPCIGTYTQQYIWTATDDCNNSTVATQSITVVDTTPPVIDTCASNVTVECYGDIPAPNTNLVSGTDNCGTVTVAWEGDLSDSNSCPEIITRTYSLTDDCGNATNCTVTITIDDTINPVLVGVPTNITVECDSVPTQAVVTATDNCATNLTVVPSTNKIDGACIGEYTLEYIWSVTDDCNNSAIATQSITVVDTTPPVIDTCASNVTVECYGDIPAPNTNLVSGTDNCGTVTVAWEGDLSDSNSCPEVITRTYSLTDDCGNATNCTVTITVNDTINPVLVGVPTNITVECDSVPTQAVVTATDNCATNLTVVPSTNKIDGACIGEYTLEYIWSVTDDCNNATVATQSITVVDTTPPVIDTCASNVTVECYGDIPAPNTNLVSGTDNCGTVTVAWGGDVSNNGSCPEVITRTYTLTDDCGNATNCTVTITVNDTINPVLVDVPTNITVQCDNVPTQAVVTATDNCATNLVVIPSTNIILGPCIGTYTQEYIWSVSDACTNTTIATQSITVVDTTPPVIDTCASNVSVQCDSDIPAVDTNLVSGTDNCGSVTVTWGGDQTDSNSCPEVITRTYTLTDDCGNATNCFQLITVYDTIRPEITCPSNVVLDCNVPFPAPDTAAVMVSDNCSTGVGEVVVAHVGDIAVTNGCDVTVMRTYSATDECGNSTNCMQTLTGHFDTEAPTVFTAGSSLIFCGFPDPGPGTLQVSDNCDPDPVVIAFPTISSSGFGGCVQTDRHIWQVIDDCGNSRVAVRLVTKLDLTPPPLVCPPDLTVTSSVACVEFIPDFNFAVTDLCVGAVVQTVQTPAPGTQVVGPTTVVVNLTATDLCGNKATCMFDYTIACTPGGDIGDYVWEDRNLNGLQEVDELGLSNIEVRLLDGNTNALASTITDTNGFYLFSNQPEGDYLVEFVAPSNGVFTLQDVGVTNDTTDSDVNIVSGFTEAFSLGLNETNLTIDAGLVLPVADIELLKTVNIDALQASCPGVELVQGTNGTPVTYCLVVTNTGNTFLSDVFVEDLDVSPTYTNTIALLAPGAAVTLAVPSTIQGDLVNTASVVGIPAYSDGTPIAGESPVMDDDPAEVRELDAGLVIRKTAYAGTLANNSAGCPGGEVIYTTNLAPVVYCLEVENVGLEYIVDIEVIDDDVMPSFSTNFTTMAPGEIANIAFQSEVFGSLTNTATVNGSAGSSNGVPYPDTSPIYDDDTATVIDMNAQMVLEQTVYVGDLGLVGCVNASNSVQVSSGTTVTYCFELMNTGDAELGSLILQAPGIYTSLGPNLLAGQSATYTKSVVVSGSSVNAARAEAQPTNPNTSIAYPVPKIKAFATASVVVIAALQEAVVDEQAAFQGVARYPVSGEGIHRVSSATLYAAGLNDLARVAVYLDGLEVAVHIEEEGSVLFYVPIGTQEAVFGERDAPLRMDVLPAAPLQ